MEEHETRICIWSEQRQKKEDAILAGKRQRFERELAALHAGLTRKRCTKRYDKVIEKLGRLKQRYRLVAAHYDIGVERAADAVVQRKGPRGGQPRPVHATAVTWRLNATGAARDERAGSYELRTSRTAWELEQVVRTYWRLTEIEATFRSLKSELGLRPVWHRRQDRIRGHLFLGVLAFHAVHALRRRLAQSGIHDSWWTIRNKLAGWERVTSHAANRRRAADREPPGHAPADGSGAHSAGGGSRASTAPPTRLAALAAPA